MYRYLALVWDTCEPPAASQAAFLQQRLRDTLPAWSQAMAAPGLAIFHIDAHQGAARSLLLPGARGAILGTLFPYCEDGEAVQATRALDEATASRIALDHGQSLLQGYWGRYVAIIKDADQPGVWVLRDPTGALPCLLAQWEGVHLVFADVEDGLAIAPVKVSIDWETLTAMLARRDVYLRTWALNGIGEVRPGERVHLSARLEHRHTAWNPLRIAAHQPVQDFGQAAGLLRRAVRTCGHSWAAQYSRIVLRLSGGLDSSIMLSTLSSAPNGAELTCAHSFAGGAGEDERRYARLMASHVGANLVERNLDDHPVRLHDVLPARRTPRAFGYLFDLEHRRHLSALCARGDSQERHRGGLFSGSGGDGVFYQARAELAVADFLLRHGLHRGLARVAVDAARMSRRSIAHLLIDALRIRAVEKEARAMQLPPIPPSPLIGRGIGPADAIHGTPLQHPWLMGMDAEKIPPGKLWHALPPSLHRPTTRHWANRMTPMCVIPICRNLCLRRACGFPPMYSSTRAMIVRCPVTPLLPICQRRS